MPYIQTNKKWSTITLPDDISKWLKREGILDIHDFEPLQTDPNFCRLTNQASKNLLCGYSIALLLHRMGLKWNIYSSFSYENVQRDKLSLFCLITICEPYRSVCELEQKKKLAS